MRLNIAHNGVRQHRKAYGTSGQYASTLKKDRKAGEVIKRDPDDPELAKYRITGQPPHAVDRQVP